MKKYKIGYTCGVFDLFHVGHLNLLERCKEMCDKLVVSICDDEYVRNVKHKEPVIGEKDRERIIAALKCVDETLIVNTDEVLDKTIVQEKYGYDAFFTGDDWKGSARLEDAKKQFESRGVDIVFFHIQQVFLHPVFARI